MAFVGRRYASSNCPVKLSKGYLHDISWSILSCINSVKVILSGVTPGPEWKLQKVAGLDLFFWRSQQTFPQRRPNCIWCRKFSSTTNICDTLFWPCVLVVSLADASLRKELLLELRKRNLSTEGSWECWQPCQISYCVGLPDHLSHYPAILTRH